MNVGMGLFFKWIKHLHIKLFYSTSNNIVYIQIKSRLRFVLS